MEKSSRVPAADPAIGRPRAEGLAGRGTKGDTSRAGARRWLIGITGGLWFLFAMLCCGELVFRLASRAGIFLFDTEMWRYAREVKRPSATEGVVLEHRPDVEARLMGVRIRTDAHGFRRPAPDLDAVRTGHERIVAVVGDSCALGWGVPEGETMSEQLERQLNSSPAAGSHRFVVINAGVGNSNTAMQYARYVHQIRPLHPIWVILAFFINDAEPDPIATNAPVLEHSVLLATLWTRLPSLLVPARRDYLTYYERLYEPQSAGLVTLRRALQAFGRALKDDGAMATVVLIPEMHAPRHFGSFAEIYRRVAALAAESGFEVVDPSDDFPPGSGRAYWVGSVDAHPNGRAHAVFAAALARSETVRQLTRPPS